MKRLLSSIAILAFFAALQFVAPPDGFFSGDQGAKYLQTRAFALQGPLHPGIEVASRDVDPAAEHQILENRRGQLVGVFSWLLPILSAPFFALLGFRGLYVVPAVSAVVIFLAAAALGRRLGAGDGAMTGWVVVLCAPVLVYGAELWEHAPAAACVAIAAVLLAPEASVRRRVFGAAFLAGAAIGVAGLFREEAVLALPAFVVARFVAMPRDERWHDAVRAGAIAAAGTIAVFALAVPMNLVVYGSPLPLHLAVETGKANMHPPARLALLAAYLLPDRFAIPFLAAAALAVFAVWRYKNTSVNGWLRAAIASSWVMLLIASLLPLWRLIALGEPASPKDLEAAGAHAYSLDSIAHTWPFLIALVFLPLVPAARMKKDLVRYLGIAAVLMTIGALAIVPSIGGAQWSPRYLFAAAPLLAALAASSFQLPGSRFGLVRSTVGIALLCAFTMQIDGLRYLAISKQRNARITHRLAELTQPGDLVITDIAWLAQVTAELIPSRRILVAWSPKQVEMLARAAAVRGLRTIALAVSMPETGFAAPPQIDTAPDGCVFSRTVRLDLRERGLILHKYGCSADTHVVK